MWGHLQMPRRGVWVLLVLNALIHEGLSAGGLKDFTKPRPDDKEDERHGLAPEVYEYHTYIILYKDAANDDTAINCTAPLNVTLPTKGANMLQKWYAPSGVLMMTSSHMAQHTIGTSGKLHNLDYGIDPHSWVELTSDNALVFHNPDDSMSGSYVCQSTSDDQLLYQTTVWVHVLRKEIFDAVERIKVACITTLVFLAIILACWGASYWCKRNKMRYTLAKCQDDQIAIPTIQIVSASAEKI